MKKPSLVLFLWHFFFFHFVRFFSLSVKFLHQLACEAR